MVETEDPWWQVIIEATSARERLYIARRDRTRKLRAELAAIRAAGLVRRHAERERRARQRREDAA
jgi:hypothetical protein